MVVNANARIAGALFPVIGKQIRFAEDLVICNSIWMNCYTNTMSLSKTKAVAACDSQDHVMKRHENSGRELVLRCGQSTGLHPLEMRC